MENLKNKIETLLKENFNPEYLEVIDDSAKHAHHKGAPQGSGHFQVKIKSKKFSGKTLIQQHRLVNDVLKDYLGSSIHALALSTSV